MNDETDTGRISDILTAEEGIFKALKIADGIKYSEIFGDIDTVILDSDFFGMYSECKASYFLRNLGIHKTAQIIWNRFFNSWQNVKRAFELDYSVTDTADKTTVTEHSKTGSKNNDEQMKTTENVYGFDSDTPTPNNDSVDSNTKKEDYTETNTTTIKVKGNSGNLPQSSLIAQELQLRKQNLIGYIMEDVKGLTTLAIF